MYPYSLPSSLRSVRTKSLKFSLEKVLFLLLSTYSSSFATIKCNISFFVFFSRLATLGAQTRTDNHCTCFFESLCVLSSGFRLDTSILIKYLPEANMQNTFDSTNINPDSFNFAIEEYLDFPRVDFQEDFSINARDPTYMCTAPADQGWVVSASVRSPVFTTSPTGLETHLLDPSLPAAMPQLVGDSSAIELYPSLPWTQGGDLNSPHFVLPLQPQRFTQSQPNLTQFNLQPPISPTGSATSAPTSSSRRRQPSPSASDEDRDASPLPALPTNSTGQEIADRKREQNKLAARRARLRRAALVARMESDVARLQREANIWRERARMMEGLLHSAGINTIPTFPDYI